MGRISCAFIDRYELMLHARIDPALLRRPCAVADIAGPGRLGAVSPIAEALGLAAGQLVASARARCPELEMIAPDPVLAHDSEREILTVLGGLSPKLDRDGRGGFFLDLEGLDRLIGSEMAHLVRVREALSALGLPATCAVADTALVAYLAARRARPVRVVAPGSDATVLSGLPLSDLPVGDRGLELFELLGLRDAAEVAALPPGELARRLGRDGARLEQLLRGSTPIVWPREELVPRDAERAALEFEQPEGDLEPLLFLGKSLIDRIIGELAGEALCELTIEVELDDRQRMTHVLRLAEPSLETRPVLDLYRLWLERKPFPEPVAKLAMVATATARPSARQLSLLRQKEEKASFALGQAMAQLSASFGPNCAVRPVLVDTYRPEARLDWQAFPLPRDGQGAQGGQGGVTSTPAAASRLAATEPQMVVRLLSPPEEISVAGGRVRRRGQPSLRVTSQEGPHRVSGDWWAGARMFARSYFWFTVEDRGRLWVFRDERDGKHYLQGVAD